MEQLAGPKEILHGTSAGILKLSRGISDGGRGDRGFLLRDNRDDSWGNEDIDVGNGGPLLILLRDRSASNDPSSCTSCLGSVYEFHARSKPIPKV